MFNVIQGATGDVQNDYDFQSHLRKLNGKLAVKADGAMNCKH